MKTSKFLIKAAEALVVCFILTAAAHGQITSRLSSSFLARGEQALLEVSVVGSQPDDIPEVGRVERVTIQPSGRGPQARMLPGRKLEYIFEYIVSSYEIGTYAIGPIEVSVNGSKSLTETLDFQVFNPDELQWSEVQAGGKIIRYASFFKAMKDKPFENETVPTDIKVFVPEELVVEDWGIPDFERDGVTAWRFQPSLMRSRINLLGSRYVSVAYPSTITPTRTGAIGIGPAKIRLTTREVVMNPFPQQVNAEVYLQVPKLAMEAVPLPEGAPDGFDNAVGNFKVTAQAAITDLQEGDPVSVDLVVSGRGNLDTLRPPTLQDATGWKIYGTTNDQRGDERRQISGAVVFHQSIRPLEMKAEIPPFRFVFFDPRDQAYRTVTTEPIALKMQPGPVSVAPPVAVQPQPVPIEKMTDILGIVRSSPLVMPANPGGGIWSVHLVGALIALGLIAKAFWVRSKYRLGKDPLRSARERELRELENASSADGAAFLKAAGAFIELRLGNDASPEVKAVLDERDAVCFRADPSMVVLATERRREIVKLLRRAALGCLVIFALGFTNLAHAADLSERAVEAYDAAKYEDALGLWFHAGAYDQLSADALYNIGNACYRFNATGQASLYYRRALLRDPSHHEARQNLRFLERKHGSIVVHRSDFQHAITGFSLAAWQATCWVGAWSVLIALLVFPATCRSSRFRMVAVCMLVIAPMLVLVGAIGWSSYPNDAEFAPLPRQAVVVADRAALHTDAARTSPEVIDAPPGSLCEIIRESGRWAYVAFASKTRGWVPLEDIEKMIPVEPVKEPKFRKPKADGKTA